MNDNEPAAIETYELVVAKQTALNYMVEAFAEAELDGLDTDCMAQAALFAAFNSLVEVYGEDAAAEYAAGLPEKIRSGAFSSGLKH